jgi:hypothetical protein
VIEITAVKLAQGGRHEHIVEVQWRNPEDGSTGNSTVESIIEWLRRPGSYAFVRDGAGRIAVAVVSVEKPYIRTYRDRVWTDNLLALPRY